MNIFLCNFIMQCAGKHLVCLQGLLRTKPQCNRDIKKKQKSYCNIEQGVRCFSILKTDSSHNKSKNSKRNGTPSLKPGIRLVHIKPIQVFG